MQQQQAVTSNHHGTNYQSLIYVVSSKGGFSEPDFNTDHKTRIFKCIDFRFNSIVLLDTNDQVTLVQQQPYQHNKTKILQSEILAPIPQLESYLTDRKHVQICQVCSDYDYKELAFLLSDHTVVDVTAKNKVSFFNSPNHTNGFVRLTSGGSFNILQTLNGNELYGYGHNYWHVLDDKQLNNGTSGGVRNIQEYSQPERIHSQLRNITHVACGWDGLLVVCNHRQLFVVGRNLSRCLGLPGYRVEELKPCPIPILDDETIVKICSCDETSLILLSSGTILFNNPRSCFERMDSEYGPFKDIGTMRDVNIFLSVENRLFIAKSPSSRCALRELRLPCQIFTSLELYSGEFSTVLHFKLEPRSVVQFKSKLWQTANMRTPWNDVDIL